MEKGRKTNKILTILLIIGTVTVFFPLYMAVIIAFKNPNEMTNDIENQNRNQCKNIRSKCQIVICSKLTLEI